MNYFNDLIGINKYVCGNESKVREDYKFNSEFSDKIDNVILNEETDIDVVIEECLNISCDISLLHPFYDGNCRTALIYFGFLLEYKGFEFDYKSALDVMNNKILILPSINNSNNNANIKSFYKYIKNYKIKR